MTLATHPDWHDQQSEPLTDKVILITRGRRDTKIAEVVREEIRQSGCTCEVLPANVSDRRQLLHLVQDVLDRFHSVDMSLKEAAIPSDFAIRKLTDEEWLAQ